MVHLTGNNLPQRQHDLNNKVLAAVASHVSLEDLKAQEETSDVDRLYKIDIAAKYKNIDYIIETFKSGDSLYISRALKKSTWLCDDDFSDKINTDYLHHYVFPNMSLLMKKKLLTAISMHLKNYRRAEEFYNYCLQAKLNTLALKYLVNTSETFKANVLKDPNNIIERDVKKEVIKCLLGESFTLFEAYLGGLNEENKNIALSACSYFYTVSDTKYLDLLEKHASVKCYKKAKLGLRISKNIATKHKDRVLAKPNFYIIALNVDKLLRHSSLSDVKVYANALLPDEVTEFWNMDYYRQYKSIIHAVPEGERYAFVKNIFADKYGNKKFEMLKRFYDQGYHNLMTKAEKEAWALRHIDSNDEILGPGLNHRWYKFVNFEKAFDDIKKIIKTTTDQLKRLEMLQILVESAEDQSHLERLLKYYYDRHRNENKNYKELFLKKVVSVHNVFEFDKNCWETLNGIFHSVNVYSIVDTHSNPDFKIISIIYHILKCKDMPDVLKNHIEYEISMYSTKTYIDKLNEEQKQTVYDYICNFYLERISKFEPGTEDNKCIAHIHFILEFMAIYKKTKEDIPDAIMAFVNRDFPTFRYQQILQENKVKLLTDGDLLRYLKKDTKLVAEKTSEVKDRMVEAWCFRLDRVLKKLRIYFPRDEVTQKYLKLFHDCLGDENLFYKLAYASVYGIMQLSDENSKIDFLNKFAPTEPKIDHANIEHKLLLTREAICRFVCYSRPPVPLQNILMYIKGDYVKFCLPMFNMYLSNLPHPLCLNFVESILDSPVSIQKHGLRLAFKCFSKEDLKSLVHNSWKKTKNISLRGVIYKAFFDKIVEKQDTEMYAILKELTSDLHEDDHEDIFPLLTSKLGDKFDGDFLETVWATIEKFKDTEQNIKRKAAVIERIESAIELVKKDFVQKIVSEHITAMFSKTEVLSEAFKCVSLHLAKWNLIALYIVYYTKTEEDCKQNVEMAKLVLSKLLESWNGVVSDVYVSRQVFAEFFNNLKSYCFLAHRIHAPCLNAQIKSYENAMVVFEAILNELQAALPLQEIYIYVWDLRVSIINRQVVKEARLEYENDSSDEVLTKSATTYGRRLGKLVQEFLERKIYFQYFADKITKLIEESASQTKWYLKFNESIDLEEDDYLVCIARGLLETKTMEANMLALRILPVEPFCINMEAYKSVYNTIQSIPDLEVQSCLHDRYSGDFKRRRFE